MSGAGKDKQYEKNRVFFRGDAARTIHQRGMCGGSAIPAPGDAGGAGMTKQRYLHGLAYDYLSDEQVLQGFAEHYLCAGLSSRDVCRDICLYASASAAKEVGDRLMDVFRILAGKEEQDED